MKLGAPLMLDPGVSFSTSGVLAQGAEPAERGVRFRQTSRG